MALVRYNPFNELKGLQEQMNRLLDVAWNREAGEEFREGVWQPPVDIYEDENSVIIKAELPEIKIVMLTMSAEDADLFEAIKSGACGYLLKTQDTDEFFALLQDVARGEVALSPGLAARILQEFGRQANVTQAIGEKEPRESLSARELEVLTLVAHGLTYKEAGAKLYLAERTIKYHMGEIVARLHLENRAQVVEYAKRTGLVR